MLDLGPVIPSVAYFRETNNDLCFVLVQGVPENLTHFVFGLLRFSMDFYGLKQISN